MKKLLAIAFTLSFFCNFSQNKKNDSLLLALKNAKHDTTKLQLRNIIGEISEILRIGFWDSIYIDAQKLKMKKIESDALNNIGFIYDSQGLIQKALEYFESSLRVKEDIGDKEGLASSLNNIAVIYQNQGNIPKALGYHERSLKIREEIGNKYGIAISFGNIGLIYQDQGEISNALYNLNKSLKMHEEIGDKQDIAVALNNIGFLYQNQGNIPQALDYYKRSLKIQEDIGYKPGIASTVTNIGLIYVSQVAYQKALNNFYRSLQIQKEIGDKEGIANTLNNIGVIYILQKKYKDALSYSDSSLILSKELGFPKIILRAEKALSVIDSAMGNYIGAFEHYKQFIIYRDSINNDVTRKASIRNQFKYEYDKKEAVINEQLKQKQKERNYFILGLVLVGLLAIFIFRGYRLKQKANTIITEQKKLVDEKQKEILDSIKYAKRIQKAHLPTDKYIDKNLGRLKEKG